MTVQLNHEQQEAVNARSGYVAVMAGPGSGKTRLLIARYQALLADGIPPNEILCLTFTDKAAKEMAARAGLKAVREHSKHERPSGFRTFHSLALAFANLERDSFPFTLDDNPLATPGITAKIIGRAIRRYPSIKFNELASFISRQKRDGIRPEKCIGIDIFHRHMAAAYREYQDSLRADGMLDFDDLLLEMRGVLASRPDVLGRWCYQHVQVDEFQDTDQIQSEILDLISSQRRNLFVVGDVGQSLYSWRGAHPDILLHFADAHRGAKTLFLGTNYRSTEQIVGLVRKLSPVNGGLGDRLVAVNGNGPAPTFTAYPTTFDEAEHVTHLISGTDKDEQDSTAVLYRTNLYGRPIEERMAQLGVKYHVLGSSGFFIQPEIRNVMSYVQCAVAAHDSAVISAIRAPFHPSRFIRKTDTARELKKAKEITGESYTQTLRGIATWNAQQGEAVNKFLSFIGNIRPYTAMRPKMSVESILRDLRAIEYYSEEEGSTPDSDPVANLRELVKIAERFTALHEFIRYIDKVTHASRRKSGVTLATVHQAKGLEWQRVYFVGVAEKILPHERSDNIDEEGRIAYVGASRAARELHISWCGTPSRFISPFLDGSSAHIGAHALQDVVA